MTLSDGTKLSPALGIGAFLDKTLVHSGQCTKVNPDIEPAVAGLLGCGVMAGLGAAINTGAVTRGDSVAVIGCGGVGDAAIAGANLAGATTIIAVDQDDRKLDWAKNFGATHTLNSKGKSEDEVVEAIQTLTNSFGADVVIDAVGRPETWRSAFYARDLAGTVVLVGVPTADRLLLPRRAAEVLVVRRLPAFARLPGAGRPVSAGEIAAGQVRHRADLRRRGRGRVRPHASRRRAAQRGRLLRP
jgi:S-(hydroxymethyl)mycothiol dehydrogenase